jgi:hypothetical protein
MSLSNEIRHEQEGDDELSFLTLEQLNILSDDFKVPFNGIDIVIDSINKQLRHETFKHFEDIEIYRGSFDDYRKKLINTFRSSLIEPGTPVGPITSDAIGQQATQALLNTFHSVGTAKSGGPEGIKENITISANRKILYSIIHMKNGNMKFSEMMELKKKFIGISIDDLLLSPPESTIVDIGKIIAINPFNDDPKIDKKKIFNSSIPWWYCLYGFDGVFSMGEKKYDIRTCLRLRFDIQKLYEYKITTKTIAEYINKWKFQIVIPKKYSTSVTKRQTEDNNVLAIPSPTHIGIIDIFTKFYFKNKDYLLLSLIHGKEFKNLIIGGIEGIKNFYAVSTPVIRLIRNIVKTSRFDTKNGMWLYLDNNRFTGIPYSRLLKLLDNAGINYEIPYYNNPDSYLKKYTDLPCEFISHKSVPELRSSFILRAYLLGNMVDHNNLLYNMTQYNNGAPSIVSMNEPVDHYEYKKIGTGFDVSLYPFTQSYKHDGLISTKKFKNKDEFTSFIDNIEYRLNHKTFLNFFDDPNNTFTNYFTDPDEIYKTVAFYIEGEKNGNYIICYLFQMKFIDYQIETNLDYINSRYVTQSLDSMLASHFWLPDIGFPDNVFPNQLRKCRLRDIKTIDLPEKRIFIKSKMFLTDRYDFIGQPFRDIIIDYVNNVKNDFTNDEKIKLIKSIALKKKEILTEDNIKTIMENQKLKPLDRLLAYIAKRNEKDDLNYVFAETSGCNFSKTITHPLIAGHKTVCNHFRQIYEVAGLEGLKNCQNNDLISMINTEGYIHVEYMNFLTNVTTFNGINPMTSQGILCQDRDWLAMTTFDSAAKYIKSAALIGKEQSTFATSTCIFLGKQFEMGTGFVKVRIDKSRLNISNRQLGISEAFIKAYGIDKPADNLFNETDEDPIFIPKIITGKFPTVSWIYDNFIERDIIFYINQGIDNFKSYILQFYEPYACNDIDLIYEDLIIGVEPSLKSFPKF